MPDYTSICSGELNEIRSKNALSAVLSTEGRVVGLCRANQNLKDLKDCGYSLAGSAAILCTGGLDVIRKAESKHSLSTEQVPVSAYVWSSKNLNDLKERI